MVVRLRIKTVVNDSRALGVAAPGDSIRPSQAAFESQDSALGSIRSSFGRSPAGHHRGTESRSAVKWRPEDTIG